jgi:hypothetical protein
VLVALTIEGSLLLWQLRTTLLTTQSFVEREESGGEILKRSVEGRIRRRSISSSNCSMLLEEIRGLGMMVLWMMACMARMLLLLLPHALPLPLLIPMLQKLSVHAEEAAATLVTTQPSRLDPYVAADGWSLTLNSSSSSPIGRALSQLLELLNRVPASSSKYEFLLSLADKVIEENKIHGVGYKSVTRTALGVGFARTINRLGRSLEGQRHQGLWLWCIPSSSPSLLAPLAVLLHHHQHHHHLLHAPFLLLHHHLLFAPLLLLRLLATSLCKPFLFLFLFFFRVLVFVKYLTANCSVVCLV